MTVETSKTTKKKDWSVKCSFSLVHSGKDDIEGLQGYLAHKK